MVVVGAGVVVAVVVAVGVAVAVVVAVAVGAGVVVGVGAVVGAVVGAGAGAGAGAGMTERELQEQVRTICAQLGLYHYHTHDSRRSQAGFPDSVIIGPRGVLFRELKSSAGRLSPDQRHVGYLLTAAGESWEVWRPQDLVSGVIQRQLAGLAGLRIASITEVAG